MYIYTELGKNVSYYIPVICSLSTYAPTHIKANLSKPILTFFIDPQQFAKEIPGNRVR